MSTPCRHHVGYWRHVTPCRLSASRDTMSAVGVTTSRTGAPRYNLACNDSHLRRLTTLSNNVTTSRTGAPHADSGLLGPGAAPGRVRAGIKRSRTAAPLRGEGRHEEQDSSSTPTRASLGPGRLQDASAPACAWYGAVTTRMYACSGP